MTFYFTYTPLTLQDIANSMGIKSSNFKTDYNMPTKDEYKKTEISARPIIVWKNPQEIKNPNPPANRNVKDK
ncbi:hypothetical protein CXF95_20875 [Paraglaciecola sp. MB-3u-78]|nr:hypothetical protein CXF95_20875 [Paraglaciecola sp. MB-3u-78]